MRAVWGPLVVASAVALAIATPLAPAAGTATLTLDRSIAATVAGQINEVRVAHGLAPLRVNVRLTRAATSHTREMAIGGYFGHESGDGEPFTWRLARFYPARGFARWQVGENLVWGSPGLSGEAVVRSWLSSSEHRAVLLAPGWREIGLAVAQVPLAPGEYRDRQTTIVTADFGVRSR
jgi:uncharacterized protein YkwD